MLRYLPDHLFRFITTRECALRESPVVFGLTKVGPWRGLSFGAIVVGVTRRVLGVNV